MMIQFFGALYRSVTLHLLVFADTNARLVSVEVCGHEALELTLYEVWPFVTI